MIREPRTGPADPRPRRRRHRHHHALHAAPPHCPAVLPRCDARLRAGGHPVGSAFPARRRGPAWRWGPRGRRRLVSAPPPCPTTGERGRGRRTCPGQATAIRTTSAMSPARLPGTGITAGQIGPGRRLRDPGLRHLERKIMDGRPSAAVQQSLTGWLLTDCGPPDCYENDVAACGSVTLAGAAGAGASARAFAEGGVRSLPPVRMSWSCWCELFSVSAWHGRVERGGRDGNGRRRQRSGQRADRFRAVRSCDG